MTHQTRVKILKLASILLLIAFAPVMAFSVLPPADWVAQHFLSLARLDVSQPYLTDPGGRLVSAILGGVLLGLGISIWQVVSLVYARDPVTGRAILLPTILGWYVLDSAGSILADAWFNAVLNTVFAACFLVPLLWRQPAGQPDA